MIFRTEAKGKGGEALGSWPRCGPWAELGEVRHLAVDGGDGRYSLSIENQGQDPQRRLNPWIYRTLYTRGALKNVYIF